MSGIVSTVLKLTFGFLSNKIRSDLPNRNVTDEECRKLIVRELDDLKSKLNGLARASLLSIFCFVQEGVNRLYQSLLQPSDGTDIPQSTELATLTQASSPGGTCPLAAKGAIALVRAITSLKIRSNERFKSAMESFKLAREKATEAFCNEALSIEDRIQASQIRMVARILESLDDPDAGVSDYLQYLKQIHDVGEIREIFSALMDGGMKSWFNQAKRLNNASSVHIINHTLYYFARNFTELPPRIFDWPTISFYGKTYHPVLGEDLLYEKFDKAGFEVIDNLPSRARVAFDKEANPDLCVVTSKREIVTATRKFSGTLNVHNQFGESPILYDVLWKEDEKERYVEAMDIDGEDNVYVLIRAKTPPDNLFSVKLLIFDANGNKKLEFSLQNLSRAKMHLAVNKNRRIAILDYKTDTLYIGSVGVRLNSYKLVKTIHLQIFHYREFSFLLKLRYLHSDKLIASHRNTIYIFTENGELEREFNTPKGSGCGFIESLAINHVTKEILIKTYYSKLLSFFENGELSDTLFSGSSYWVKSARLSSHFSGPVVLVHRTGEVYLA